MRYEQQQREAEQAALVQSVRDSVEAELNKPAFRRQLLEEALTQVERESGQAWLYEADVGSQSCPRTKLSEEECALAGWGDHVFKCGRRGEVE